MSPAAPPPLSRDSTPTLWIHHPDRARVLTYLRDKLAEVFRPRPGACYVLKPNLCGVHPPQRGAITDIDITGCLLAHLRDHRAYGRIVELPPHIREAERVFHLTGYRQLAARHGADLVDPERTGGFLPRGNLLPGVPLGIARAALESDGVINLPKVKTHRRAFYTGAVKNLMGLTDMRTRHLMHLVGLHRTLPALYRAVGPHVVLNVADALIAMDGDGPSRGDPVRLDSVILGPDAVRLDCQILRQVELSAARVPYLSTLLREAGDPDLPAPVFVPGETPPRRAFRPVPTRVGALDYAKEALITQPAIRRLLQHLEVDRIATRRVVPPMSPSPDEPPCPNGALERARLREERYLGGGTRLEGGGGSAARESDARSGRAALWSLLRRSLSLARRG